MQGDFAKLQGWRRLFSAETHRISMAWMGLSLIQEQGDEASIAGKVDLQKMQAAPVLSSISTLFGRATALHQTPQLHSLAFFVGRVIGAASPQAA
jgi:hypothetical protein